MGCTPGSLSCTCVNARCWLGTGAGYLGPGLLPGPAASWIIAHNNLFWKLYVRLGLTVRMAGTCITSFCRNASSSSAGKAQKNDFNTTVVSPMQVFRSYPSTSSSLQVRPGYTSAPEETCST